MIFAILFILWGLDCIKIETLMLLLLLVLVLKVANERAPSLLSGLQSMQQPRVAEGRHGEGCHQVCQVARLGAASRSERLHLEFLSAVLAQTKLPTIIDKVSYHADNAGGAHGKDSNDK